MLLAVAGCADEVAGERPATTPTPTPTRKSTAAPPKKDKRLAALEREYDARLGLYALATGSGGLLTHRADERFAFCSTFKPLAVAAVLHHNPPGHLEKRIAIEADDIDSISPITRAHVGSTMTIEELCDAAIRYSDGTAANLLLRDLGGPDELTAYMRGLGDRVSRLDDFEPELSLIKPGDPRDTTTPRAIGEDYRRLVLGDALPEAERARLTDWLERSTTGAERVRAGLPRGWRIAHKTGTGDYGRANDIAILWPPAGAPLILAIMTDRTGRDAARKERLIADATAYTIRKLD